MSTVREYLVEAIAARKTKTEAAKELGIQWAELNAYVAEYGLTWPIFRKPQPVSGVCALKAGKVEYHGELLTVRELWQLYGQHNGLSLSVVQKRISNGYTPHDAVTIPKGKHRCTQS